MPRQIQQTGVKVDVIAAPLEHGTFEIVIENHARRTGEVLKGMDVAAKNILHLLIEEKLQVERPRMGQGDDEARQRALGAADLYVAEVRPVGLSLFGGEGMEPEECFRPFETHGGNGAPLPV